MPGKPETAKCFSIIADCGPAAGLNIVAPAEINKHTKHYRTDAEVLLGCILVSGTRDTAVVLSAEIAFQQGTDLSAFQLAAHAAFRRVWRLQLPTNAGKFSPGRPGSEAGVHRSLPGTAWRHEQ
jgi:hypothetical protein